MAFNAAVIKLIGIDGSERSCEAWIKAVFEVAKVTGREVDRYLLGDIQRVLKEHRISAARSV